MAEEDWATAKAFAWCAERGLSPDKHASSVAALLREVWVAGGETNRAALLGKVCQTVERVRAKWAAFHNVAPAPCSEILDRLRKL